MHVAHHCLLFSVLMQVRAVCAALDLGGKWSAYSRPRQLPACGAAVEGRGLCAREGLPPGDHTAQGGRQMSKEIVDGHHSKAVIQQHCFSLYRTRA
jgi:hypothetical protein